MNQYEAMFLFDPTFGNSFENCEAEVRRLMERAEAEILFCSKWDERRLAYRIDGRKRGVYVLVYFKAQPSKIVGLERDAQLSENILRVLILCADGVTPEMMDRAVASHGAETVTKTTVSEAPKDAPQAPDKTEQPRKDEAVEVRADAEAEPIAMETAVADKPENDEPAVDGEEARTVEVSFSSEEPVERYFGTEILDHSPKAVRLGRLNSVGVCKNRWRPQGSSRFTLR